MATWPARAGSKGEEESTARRPRRAAEDRLGDDGAAEDTPNSRPDDVTGEGFLSAYL